MSSYNRPLKVSTPGGEVVIAKITASIYQIKIEIPYLKEVEKDNPKFSKNGIIKMLCDRDKYMEVIHKVTKYLEDLFLKGMADEDIHPSTGSQSKSRGTEKDDSKGKVGRPEGKRDSASVLTCPRGNKPAESVRRGESDFKMAEIDDSEIKRKD